MTINGEPAVEGALPTDPTGSSTGTLDGQYKRAKVHVDCSSQNKSADWIETRCRVLVNNEPAATLIM